MHTKLMTALGVAGIALATQAPAQLTLYEGQGFRGRTFSANGEVRNLAGSGFNDRASSAVVENGRWEVCEHEQFGGKCVVLRKGSYDTLVGMGLDNSISSVRPLSRNARNVYEAPPPMAAPTYEYRQRPNERLYEANVTSVRAVVGPPENRCWVERQQVVDDRSGANVPGAIIGGIIGGVLGHQVGGGRGRDVATAGGAVAGAAIGANAGRGGGGVYAQDVQRCESVPGSARPAFWEVTYNFRGIEHRVQMSTPPGATIAVNGNGEPRG
jgi:uncharacterized protein YcfJ